MNNEIWPENTDERVKVMIDKIDNCLKRVLDNKPDATTIQCSGETIHIKTEGLI